VDSFGNWMLGTLVVFVLALIFTSFLFAFVCLVISAEIAVMRWTGLREWLAIPEPAPRQRRRTASSERLDA
jgi:hypothetical protein